MRLNNFRRLMMSCCVNRQDQRVLERDFWNCYVVGYEMKIKLAQTESKDCIWDLHNYILPPQIQNRYKNTKKYNLSKLKARSDPRRWNINTSSQLLQIDKAAAQTLQTFVNPGHLYLHHFFILFFLLLRSLQHQLYINLFWYHSAVCHFCLPLNYPNWQAEAREGRV